MIFDDMFGKFINEKSNIADVLMVQEFACFSTSSLPIISRKFSFILSCSVSGIMLQIYYLYCTMLEDIAVLIYCTHKKNGQWSVYFGSHKANTIVEVSPVIVMNARERKLPRSNLVT